MKYATAVSRLQSVAEEANDHWLRFGDTEIGWPVDELWVAGELLDGPEELDALAMILMLDEPVDELPWLALHASGEWVGERLRLTKLPIAWAYRPAVYPAWNARYQRVLRFWSAKAGPDREVIEQLSQRRLDRLPIVTPAPEELAVQLEVELEACRRYLGQVLEDYWDDGWRRRHRGFGVDPEDHLWRAAMAVHEIGDALDGARRRQAGP
ncbi:MAG TPA: hypothetical protein VKQ71_00680 [Acidimicrobiales bacterium]|nr:hypothetical protein [Acidimicrobiales bacterium]